MFISDAIVREGDKSAEKSVKNAFFWHVFTKLKGLMMKYQVEILKEVSDNIGATLCKIL